MSGAAVFGVVAAGMAAVVVMAAADIGIVCEIAVDQRFYRFIGIAGNAAVKTDAGFFQRHLSAAADPSADQRVYAVVEKETGQSAVTLSHGVDDLFAYDSAVFDVVYFELGGVAEVLKDHTVFVSNCNSHVVCSFRG